MRRILSLAAACAVAASGRLANGTSAARAADDDPTSAPPRTWRWSSVDHACDEPFSHACESTSKAKYRCQHCGDCDVQKLRAQSLDRWVRKARKAYAMCRLFPKSHVCKKPDQGHRCVAAAAGKMTSTVEARVCTSTISRGNAAATVCGDQRSVAATPRLWCAVINDRSRQRLDDSVWNQSSVALTPRLRPASSHRCPRGASCSSCSQRSPSGCSVISRVRTRCSDNFTAQACGASRRVAASRAVASARRAIGSSTPGPARRRGPRTRTPRSKSSSSCCSGSN